MGTIKSAPLKNMSCPEVERAKKDARRSHKIRAKKKLLKAQEKFKPKPTRQINFAGETVNEV